MTTPDPEAEAVENFIQRVRELAEGVTEQRVQRASDAIARLEEWTA